MFFNHRSLHLTLSDLCKSEPTVSPDKPMGPMITLGTSPGQIFPDNPFRLSTVCIRPCLDVNICVQLSHLTSCLLSSCSRKWAKVEGAEAACFSIGLPGKRPFSSTSVGGKRRGPPAYLLLLFHHLIVDLKNCIIKSLGLRASCLLVVVRVVVTFLLLCFTTELQKYGNMETRFA